MRAQVLQVLPQELRRREGEVERPLSLLSRDLLLHPLCPQRHDGAAEVHVHPHGRGHQQAAAKQHLLAVLRGGPGRAAGPAQQRERAGGREDSAQERGRAQQDERKNAQHSLPAVGPAHPLRLGEEEREEQVETGLVPARPLPAQDRAELS